MLAWILMTTARAGAPEHMWVDFADEGAACVSRVPDAGRMARPDRDGWHGWTLTLAGVDHDGAAAAAATLDALRTDHPGWSSAEAALALATGIPDVSGAVALADAWPADPCLAATAAVSLYVALGDQADAALIERYVGRAWLYAPHPELALVLGSLLLVRGELDRAATVVQHGLDRAPGHRGLTLLRARIGLTRGDDPASLDALLALHRSGDPRMDGPLYAALYRAGRRGEALEVLTRAGAPVAGARDLVLAADDPIAALIGHLSGLAAGPGPAPLTARIQTSLGPLECVLFPDVAPVTVANFVGLATGAQPWVDPTTGVERADPFYAGTTFHRVIPNFMIQGGDPLGTGEGGPGYAFTDEISPGLRFDQPGRLAMANAGPATNGSQFFVTSAPTPFLDGKHTIFGQCGPLELVERITAVPRDATDKPLTPVVIEEIRIESSQIPP